MTKRRPEPTVGGASAREIYSTIEAMPIDVHPDGSLTFEIHLCRQHGKQLYDAYHRVEKQVMVGMMRCKLESEHGPMSDSQWKWMVIHAMADEARRKLGIRSPHPFWC